MKFRILKLILWIIAISSFFFHKNYKEVAEFKLETNIDYTVEKWNNFKSTLQEIGKFDDLYIRFYLKNNSIKWNLITGNYSFQKWQTLPEIIQILQTWPKLTFDKLRIAEGWNIYDIDYYLAEKNLIKKWDFIKESTNVWYYTKDFPFLRETISLEWFLYPDTYFINPSNFSLQGFTKTLLNNFYNRVFEWTDLKLKTAEEIVGIINLASIVDKEANHNTRDEEKMIAGILKKRLDNNWFIWADITACYAYELTSYDCKMNLSRYIYEKNDYNTRTKKWLPLTPILNPRIESIEAVLNPIESDYWFYLHDSSTWKIYYAKTNEEHNSNRYNIIK